jgi:Kef-type K+ transport system membrane component KefB
MGWWELLRDLVVMFVGAQLAGLALRVAGQPAVIGEVIAGILIGPHLLGWIGYTPAFGTLQELGAVILLFSVGLDTSLSELLAVGGRSLAVGSLGVALPFALGFLLLEATGRSVNESIFIGAALVATSVGVTARVLSDLGRLKEPESRVILGAAVIDDVFGLLILAVVIGAASGTLSAGAILLHIAIAVGVVAFVAGLGPAAVRRAVPLLDRLGDWGVFAIGLAFCLALARATAALGLAAVVGSFLAGVTLADHRDRWQLGRKLKPLYFLLVPFFFVVTGSLVDLSVFRDGATLLLLGLVVAVAVVGKVAGCGAAALGMGRRAALVVGVGMMPRGEVGILVASVGLSRGIIDGALYSIVVATSVLTTLAAPPLLAILFRGPADEDGGEFS